MIIINSADSAKFELNGIEYPRNFICIKQGSDSIAIHNAYDTRHQLLGSTKYNQITVDEVIYSNQSDLMSALATVLFAKNVFIENPDTVPSTTASLEEKITIVNGDAAIIGDSNDGGKIKKTAWFNVWDNYLKGKVNTLLAAFKSDNFLDFTSSGQIQLNSKIPLSQKGFANGVATLGTDAKIPSNQINFGSLSGTVAEGDKFIQLSGTEGGNRITGSLEFDTSATGNNGIYTELTDENGDDPTFLSYVSLISQLNNGGVRISSQDYINSNSGTILVNSVGAYVNGNGDFNGLIGEQYFNPISGNSFVQKTYVDSVGNTLNSSIDLKIPLLQKAAANGVATLGADSKIPNNQLPALAITDTFPVASQAAMLALSTAEQGDVCIRTDLNKSFILAQTPSSTLSNWKELLTPTDSVTSVDGQVGVVNLSTVYAKTDGSNAVAGSTWNITAEKVNNIAEMPIINSTGIMPTLTTGLTALLGKHSNGGLYKFDSTALGEFITSKVDKLGGFKADINAEMETGFYYVYENALGVPSELPSGANVLQHIQVEAIYTASQFLYTRFPLNEIYTRTKNNGIWTEWRKIALDSNVIHKTGDETKTGSLTVTDLLKSNNAIINNHNIRKSIVSDLSLSGPSRTFLRIAPNTQLNFISGTFKVHAGYYATLATGTVELETGVFSDNGGTGVLGTSRIKSESSLAAVNLRVSDLIIVDGYLGFYIYHSNTNIVYVDFDGFIHSNVLPINLNWTFTAWEAFTFPERRGIEIEGKLKVADNITTIPATLSNHAVTLSQLATKANDSDVVHKTGNETITGTKTFSSSPIIPNATASNHPLSAGQADGLYQPIYENTEWVTLSHSLPASYSDVVLQYKIKDNHYIIDFKATCTGTAVVGIDDNFLVSSNLPNIDSEKLRKIVLDNFEESSNAGLLSFRLISSGEPETGVDLYCNLRDTSVGGTQFRAILPIVKM